MEHKRKPLTSEQLQEMVGKPVWSAKAEEWFLICKKDCEYLLYDKNGFCISLWDVFDYGLYAQPPARIDREAWKPCEYCGGDIDDRPFLDSNDLYIGDNGRLMTCDMNSSLCEIQFCPKCGRPLTPDAWDALEKRIGG